MGLRWGRVGLEWGLGGKNDIETSRKQKNKLDIWFISSMIVGMVICGGDGG